MTWLAAAADDAHRKTCLTITGMCLMVLHAFSQGSPKDTGAYGPRPLKLDEVEIVSSYYDQTADKSAVSGGQLGPIGNADVTIWLRRRRGNHPRNISS
jgi:hypothetical protein